MRLVEEYETALSQLTGGRHVIAFCYARTALAAILSAYGLKPGDQVVLSPLTCQVVPLVLFSLRLRPVYADVDPNTLNLDVRSTESVLTPQTRAILFQRTYGISEGITEARTLAKARGLRLIEDCAQCFPITAGLDAPETAIYSNNLRKPMPAGSGGVAVTSDDGLARELYRVRDSLVAEDLRATLRLRAEVFLHSSVLNPSRYWLLYGLSRKFLSKPLKSLDSGIATDITSAARKPSSFRMKQGLEWLRRLNDVASHSQRCCEDYAESLRDLNAFCVPAAMREKRLYYFPVRVPWKKDLLCRARNYRLEVIAWPEWSPIFPLERAADAATLGYQTGMCPQADKVAQELVGLPTEVQVTSNHRKRIVGLVRSALTL